jgi:hypothetical protein
MLALSGYRRGVAGLALALVAAAFTLSACGGSSSDGASEVAKQDELRAARAEAAQNARQSARIAGLEHKLEAADKAHAESRISPAPTSPTVPVTGSPARPSSEAAPLEGLWRGEAAIAYDDGGSDPFEQTIRIESLVPGQVSGSSEAVQGSTTCHGPITFQGMSQGWYRFSAEEQNKAECIDSSVVELMPVSSSAVEYREATEVSLSTGTLQRIN